MITNNFLVKIAKIMEVIIYKYSKLCGQIIMLTLCFAQPNIHTTMLYIFHLSIPLTLNVTKDIFGMFMKIFSIRSAESCSSKG